MTQKKNDVFHKDALVLILLAVVFSAVAVILLRTTGADNLGSIVQPEQKQTAVTETPADLMKDLDMAGSDLEFPEFDQLKDQAKGL